MKSRRISKPIKISLLLLFVASIPVVFLAWIYDGAYNPLYDAGMAHNWGRVRTLL